MKIHLLSLPAFVILLLGSGTATAQNFADVSVGTLHICAITDAANVECTTASLVQRYGPPADLPQVIDIAAGDQHTCAIDLEGQALCWGGAEIEFDGVKNSGAFGQLKIPAIDQPLVSIEAGAHHSCAVDVTGRAWCWGLDTNQQSQPPGDGFGTNGGGFIKVDGGENFSCGIQTDGDIDCWSSDSSRAAYIPGPFIDLDVSRWSSCGLKNDGNIECWTQQFEPPNNGPYTDLAVSGMAICGLNQNQTMDCTYNPGPNLVLPIIDVNTKFSAIESGSPRFGLQRPFCGITLFGSIECMASDQLPAPPGATSETDQDFTRPLLLTAKRYGENRIELFWPITDKTNAGEQVFMEIYRNDVLIKTTDSNRSWYDTTEQTQNPAVYKIRATDRLGNVGPFSAPISVDINSGDVTYEDQTSFELVPPLFTVDSIELLESGQSYFVEWTGSTAGENGLKGYEVRINGEPVSFTDGFRHQLEFFNASDCNIISVAAMSDQGTIFDYRARTINQFSQTGSSCANP